MRPDTAADTERCAPIHERTALLDVQLDEHADPAQSFVIAAKLRGVDASSTHRLIEVHAVDINEPTGGFR